MTGGAVIEARELRKRYGERTALDGVTLEVRGGECVGLLGPNGAGKTTTLAILAGVIAADAGEAAIAGHRLDGEPAAARRALGLVPQSLALYPTLTALENLEFFGRIQGLAARAATARVRAMLEEVGLADRADDRVDTFSGGMKRRLNLACGMLHEPAALLLDEPTAGVDPQSRGRIFAVVEEARARGAAILYSTHYMEEVERLADRVVLIDHGRVVAQGSAAELIVRAGAEPRIEVVTRDPLAPGWASGIDGIRELPWNDGERNGAALALAAVEIVPEVIRRAERAGGQVIEFHLHRPNLQDAFLALTGHALRDTP